MELLVEVQEEEAAKKRLQQRPCSPAMEDGSSRPRIVREAWWLETGGMGTAAVSGPRSPGASAGRRARQGKQTIRPKPKPVTKSVPMTGEIFSLTIEQSSCTCYAETTQCLHYSGTVVVFLV